MALPSNLQCALDGSPLPFFSPYPLPGSSGVNLFAQRPGNHGCLFSNPYVFPPLFLSHRFFALSKLTVLLALLLFLMSGLVNFGGLFFNRILLSCLPPRVLRAEFPPPPPLSPQGYFCLLASPWGFVGLLHRSHFGFISIDLFRSVFICCHAFTL